MSLTPTQRSQALRATETDLLWIAMHWSKACAVLVDGEMQAAIIAAQDYAGVGTPTDGTIAYSDPTGQQAISAGSTALRAIEVRRTWLAELAEVHEAVAHLTAVTGKAGDLVPGGPMPRANMATTLRRLGWLTMVPANRAAQIHHTATAEQLGEYDHAISHAEAAAMRLRSGSLTTSSGKRCPSVHGVILAAHKVTEAAPPAPVQKALLTCHDCASYGINRNVAAGVSRTRCEDCHRFRKSQGVKPTEAICRRWDYDRSVPPGMILEAKAASKRKAKAS